MLKAYKFRLYPNKEQREYFAKCFGCTRFIYNQMLSDKIKHYENTKEMLNNTPAQYKKEFPWLKEVDSLALANSQLDLQTAYRSFLEDKSVGFPKFKSKKNNRYSYTTNNQKGTIYIEDGFIKLPKLKTLVKIVKHRSFDGEIKSCTISKTPTDKYYVSILVDEDVKGYQWVYLGKCKQRVFLTRKGIDGSEYQYEGYCFMGDGRRLDFETKLKLAVKNHGKYNGLTFLKGNKKLVNKVSHVDLELFPRYTHKWEDYSGWYSNSS